MELLYLGFTYTTFYRNDTPCSERTKKWQKRKKNRKGEDLNVEKHIHKISTWYFFRFPIARGIRFSFIVLYILNNVIVLVVPHPP